MRRQVAKVQWAMRAISSRVWLLTRQLRHERRHCLNRYGVEMTLVGKGAVGGHARRDMGCPMPCPGSDSPSLSRL